MRQLILIHIKQFGSMNDKAHINVNGFRPNRSDWTTYNMYIIFLRHLSGYISHNESCRSFIRIK